MQLDFFRILLGILGVFFCLDSSNIFLDYVVAKFSTLDDSKGEIKSCQPNYYARDTDRPTGGGQCIMHPHETGHEKHIEIWGTSILSFFN